MYLDGFLYLSTVAARWVIDCVCMCMSSSLKAGTNLPKKHVCHHIFDRAQQGIWTDSASRMLLSAKITCCMLGQQYGYISGIPLRLLLRSYHGLSSPSCIPRALPFPTCSILNLLQSAVLRLKVNTEVTVETDADKNEPQVEPLHQAFALWLNICTG